MHYTQLHHLQFLYKYIYIYYKTYGTLLSMPLVEISTILSCSYYMSHQFDSGRIDSIPYDCSLRT